MFFSSNAIVVETFDVTVEELKNFSFGENGKFLSITFYDQHKTSGEIHWSNSFEFGKMNIINFYRIDNKFILFTSSAQNHEYLKILLSKLLNRDVNINLLKIPLPVPKDISFDTFEEVKSFEIDEYFGLSLIITIEGKIILLKIYTNGLITYTLTDNEEVLRKILELALKFILMINE
ncbi:hypothetical protein [Schinkia azotoformans]|uniref:hypothetical protein n=1 Tax=Schinkia azotoformans TaxID=1454 RepID=UPI002DB79CA6|nr:hypothetical protein [Schinkia azotoformans]MEC1719056.1 hypothetical protein [Schinkia azotoformans]MED4413895.1 hypothetical protein [Schinkia azotoformans]